MLSYDKIKNLKAPTVRLKESTTLHKPNREEKKRQTRQNFFNAVLDLCSLGQGFSSISLRQITREVGVVPTAFYRHFHDMEELGKSLVEDELGLALATLREHMQLGKKRDFDHQIAKSVQLFFSAVDAQPRYWQFLVSERFGGSYAVRKAIADQIAMSIKVISDDLALQPAFAHISDDDRSLLAEVALNMALAWVVEWIELTPVAKDEDEDDDDTKHDNQDNKESSPYDEATIAKQKQAMLHRCTRQSQMLFYGAYNWKSGEKTVIE